MTRSLQTLAAQRRVIAEAAFLSLLDPTKGPSLGSVQLGAADISHRPQGCGACTSRGALEGSPLRVEQLLVHRAPKRRNVFPQLSKKALCKWKEPRP